MTTKDYELVADQPSYYSAKVRACLQYKRLPYLETGCNIETLSQRVIPATGDHTFPVVFCPDGSVLKDGCDIIRELDKRHPERPVTPEDPTLNMLATLLETLCDDFFALPMIYYRWIPKDTREWGLNMFAVLNSYGVKDAELSKNAKEMSAFVANEIQSRLPKVGLDREDVQQEAIKVTEKTCDLLEAHLSKTPFILGDKPSIADLAFMNAMWGHLYFDPCAASMYIRRHCIYLSRWISNMHTAAGMTAEGELYLTDSLKDLLGYFGSAFGHMIGEILKAADEHLPDMKLNAPVKAGLGKIDTCFMDVQIKPPASTYTAWKLSKVIDLYQELSVTEKEQTKALLDKLGFSAITEHDANWCMEKRNFKLHLVNQ